MLGHFQAPYGNGTDQVGTWIWLSLLGTYEVTVVGIKLLYTEWYQLDSLVAPWVRQPKWVPSTESDAERNPSPATSHCGWPRHLTRGAKLNIQPLWETTRSQACKTCWSPEHVRLNKNEGGVISWCRHPLMLTPEGPMMPTANTGLDTESDHWSI